MGLNKKGFKRVGTPTNINVLKWDEKKVKKIKCSCGAVIGERSGDDPAGLFRIGKLILGGKPKATCPKCGKETKLWENK